MLVLNAAGPPTGGPFPTGETAIDSNGASWYCSAGGSPGTWVSGKNPPATRSAPTFTSGTYQQLSTTQDVMLYIITNTAFTYTAYLSSTNSGGDLVAQGQTTPAAKQSQSIRVPAGWYVAVTCTTMADLAFVQITC